jgi:hypothetical protein
MKQLIFLLSFLPSLANSQVKPSTFSRLLNKNWQAVSAVNISNKSDTVYNIERGVRTWNLDGLDLYQDPSGNVIFMAGSENPQLVRPDSVSFDRFILHARMPGGFPCIYEFCDIRYGQGKLSYTFRRWSFTKGDPTGTRRFDYGFKAFLQKSKAEKPRPSWLEAEKKFGSKIEFLLMNPDNSPLANKEVQITTISNGFHLTNSLYTDEKGKACGYFSDHQFEQNGHITILLKYQSFQSSAVVEKKHCPITVKRVLQVESNGDEKIAAPPGE